MINLSLPSFSELPILSAKPSPKNHAPPPPTSFIPHNGSRFLKRRLIRHVDAGQLPQAVSILHLMSQHGTYPALITYTLLLDSCIRTHNFQLGKVVHDHLARSAVEPDSAILNSLISLYDKCGEWERANAIFDTMGDKRNLVSWGLLLSCYVNNGLNYETICTFFNMVECGFYPNGYCFSTVVRACSNEEYVTIGEVIFGFVLKTGYLASNACVGCTLIDMFVKGRSDLGNAFKVFDQMHDRDLVAWTLMITRFQQLGCSREVFDLFLEMILGGCAPDKFTLSGVISACSEMGSLALGQQLHSWVVKLGLAFGVCIGCSLVDMYAKCEADVNDSRKVFDRMADHDVASWTAIISRYVQDGGRDREAVELFCEMIQGPVKPERVTISKVLMACANLSNPRTGEQVYAYSLKLGLATNLFGSPDFLKDYDKDLKS